MSAIRKPCKSCPWRLDETGENIPGLSRDLIASLGKTTSGELGAPMMACHQSKPNEEVVCASWLAVHGWDSITVRLNMIDGRYTPEMLEPGEDWPELHKTCEEMMEKLYELPDLRDKCELESVDAS